MNSHVKTASTSIAEHYTDTIKDLIMKEGARSYLTQLQSKKYFNANRDMGTSNAEREHLEISGINLETVTAEYFLPYLKDTKIRGVVYLDADISKDDGDEADKFTVRSEVTVHDLSIISKNLQVNFKGKELKISVSAVYDFKHDHMNIEYLQTQLSQLSAWTIRGTFKNILSGNPVVNLNGEGEISLQEIKESISGPATVWLDVTDSEASGRASLAVTGNLRSPDIQGVLNVQGEQFGLLNTVFSSYEITIPVRYQQDVFTAKDVFINAKECGYFHGRKKEDFRTRLANATIKIPHLEYTGSRIKSDIVRITADRVDITADGKNYMSDEEISLRLALEGDVDNQIITFRDISFNSDFIKGASSDISVSLDKPVTINARADNIKFDIKELLQKFSHFLPQQKGITAHGTAAVQSALQITIPGADDYHISGTAHLSIAEAGFSSSDETMIGEGISMKVSGSYEFPMPLQWIDFTVNAESTGFELLIDKFYGSFTDKTLRYSAEGRYAKAGDTLSVTRSELQLTDTGSIMISGDIAGATTTPSYHLEIDLVNLSNREGYDFFVRETFQEQIPFLTQLEVSGTSSMKLAVKGTGDSFNARGDIVIADMNIQGESPDRYVRGLNISLPVNISYPEAVNSEEEKRFGAVTVKNVSWASIAFNDVAIFPSIWQNDIFFKDDIHVPLFGGRVVLRNIFYRNILNPARKLHLAVDVDNIDLAEVSSALDIPAFNGTLSGTIPSATFAENRLLTEGEIVLELFDGNIKVSNLSMNRVFSSVPSVKSSIEVEDLDLGQLTGTFDFGHISGIIRGSVQDLVIVKGQAQSFKASLESVKKRGISQKISVTALKKISILGSGTSASVLDRGIYQFFDEYRYQKLGFKAFLKNDNLLLLGIESKGNRGYLVKGGLIPPKVDVVNYNQNVSFQEMVKRLKRIRQVKQ